MAYTSMQINRLLNSFVNEALSKSFLNKTVGKYGESFKKLHSSYSIPAPYGHLSYFMSLMVSHPVNVEKRIWRS